jgi:hypothetical protein
MTEQTMAAADTVGAYGAVWSEPDARARVERLQSCWADAGVYHDPLGRAEGREQLAAHIGGWQERMPGHRIDITSGVDEHDGHVRFAWRMYGPDGTEVMEGMDYGRLDEDGRLALIIGFFGPLR